METKYYFREITGTKFYVAVKANAYMYIRITENKVSYSIDTVEKSDECWEIPSDYPEITQQEFEKAYVEIYSRIQLNFLNLKGQTENEFIRNVALAADQLD